MAASRSTYLVFGRTMGCVNFEPLYDLSCWSGSPYNLDYLSSFEIRITLSSSLSRRRTRFLATYNWHIVSCTISYQTMKCESILFWFDLIRLTEKSKHVFAQPFPVYVVCIRFIKYLEYLSLNEWIWKILGRQFWTDIRNILRTNSCPRDPYLSSHKIQSW